MSHVSQITAQINFSQKLPEDMKVSMGFSPEPLKQMGYNMFVMISTPSMTKNANPQMEIKSIAVMAHFDTGASRTSIDKTLAAYLGLAPVGMGSVHTAAGLTQQPNFAVDIAFPGTELSPFINLPISSCDLPFKFDDNGSPIMSPQNFGLLIGRDIMSKWNIVWNGPTSTVFISD